MEHRSYIVSAILCLYIVHHTMTCALIEIPENIQIDMDQEFDNTIGQENELIRENIMRDMYLAGKKLVAVKYNGRNYSRATSGRSMQYMTTPEIIAAFGYEAESHTIRTEDSYLLTLHRIKQMPGRVSPNNHTVLLHHGLLGSSADWVLTGPKKSLAFILSDLGYDVWLANARGNTYSRGHAILDPDSMAYWNFTFHEIGVYDLPAVIDYIRAIKGNDSKLYYIGHSMGTTVLFILLSTRPEYNEKLTKAITLAPVAYMTDIRSPIRLLAEHSRSIRYLLKLFGLKQFLPQSYLLQWLSENMCELNNYSEKLCENSMFVLTGYDEKQFNSTLFPVILGHVPAGASTMTVIHYAQEIQSGGRFQRFDYGPSMNVMIYGSQIPPEYEIWKITLPIALISAKNDWLSSDVDVANLFVKLRNGIGHYVVPYDSFNHIDFLWGIDAPTLVYSKVIEYMYESFTAKKGGWESLLGKPRKAERTLYQPVFLR